MSGMEQIQRFALQQTLSPQMRQSLQILQVPLMELRGLLATEMMLNPILEEEDSSNSQESSEKNLSPLEEEWNTYYVQSAPSQEAQQEHHQFVINSLTEANTLHRFLSEQIRGIALNPKEKRIAAWIIGNINDSGYLDASLEEISQSTRADIEHVKEILTRVQTLDPPGIAARNLQECLLLQLQRQKKEDSLENKIITSHLEALARHKLAEIAKALHVPLAEVSKAADNITYLDPKPGRAFTNTTEIFVTPDIIIEKEEDSGEYRVFLNNTNLPRLRINTSYKELLSQTDNTLELRDYIREKIRGGRFLIRSIQQRQETILQIAKQIVSHQQEFLKNGPSYLRPMTMAQIAKIVGLHETTISRAVSGKYMATPQGIFEMKYFFTSGYQTAEGKTVSNESVRKAILEIISKEDPAHPWSDQQIVGLLKEKGLPIARRTIAKYREQLSILPSSLRKKF